MRPILERIDHAVNQAERGRFSACGSMGLGIKSTAVITTFIFAVIIVVVIVIINRLTDVE